jgi:hypothetical protein
MAGNDPQDQPKHWVGLEELNFFVGAHYPELLLAYSSRNARIYTKYTQDSRDYLMF